MRSEVEKDLAVFIVRCALQQAQSLTEMLAGALTLLEGAVSTPEACLHPAKSRLDLSTFSRTKWTCRECGHAVDEPRAADAMHAIAEKFGSEAA